MKSRIFGICNNAMAGRRELNPRKVDSQSTALIHLATSTPYPAKGLFFLFSCFKERRTGYSHLI
ncbi:hypothetical protein ZWY2020_020174 [Hordeum vulgare]|nr:hypothetical protein ZWY2020_020174 [Hordeum vulgare]